MLPCFSMTTYSDTAFDAQRYNSARPSYPDAFYATLLKYHGAKRDLAVDVGCGSGFVALKLAQHFDAVVGTDISPTMIAQCRAGASVRFAVAPAEELPPEIERGSVSLVTAAECCHWVDLIKFFEEASRILRPGGTLAYWFYKDPVFVDFPRANEIYNRFCYGTETAIDEGQPWDLYMGPSWEQPGRNLLRGLLRGVEPPAEHFRDVVRHEYRADNHEPSSTLYIARVVTLQGILDYVQSWSAYHTWQKRFGAAHGDIAERFVATLQQELGWADDFEFKIVWDTVYTFAKRK